jgi:hypothetical protein
MGFAVVNQSNGRLFSDTIIDALPLAITPAVNPPDAIAGPPEITR